jgi:hypothetical protein
MKDKTILFAIVSILIIQLMLAFSNEFKLNRIEQKVDQYFAPIEDVELPKWEGQH